MIWKFILSTVLLIGIGGCRKPISQDPNLPGNPSVSATTLRKDLFRSLEIEPQDNTPTEIRDLIPGGSKSYFWGKFSLDADKQIYGILLFKRNPLQGQNPSTKRLDFTLYVFHQEEQQSFIKINSIEISYKSQIWAPTKFNAALLWLDKNSKIPIIKFLIYVPDGVAGPIGDEVAVVFRNGFLKPALVQSWDWGSWTSSGTIFQRNDWTSRDKRGFLRIVSTLGYATMIGNERDIAGKTKIWTWDHSRFKVARSFDTLANDIKDDGTLKKLPKE